MNSSIIPTVTLGIDLGDKKHAVCVLDQAGKVLKEFSMRNRPEDLMHLAALYPGARMAMEVGAQSPWISRLLEAEGAEVIVANARKLRAIYTNERKSDRIDARMLARLARVDVELLCPIRHGSEQAQRDLLLLKQRDSLVRQRADLINSVRGSLKSLGIRLPSPKSSAFARQARKELDGRHPQILLAIESSIEALDHLTRSIRDYDRAVADVIETRYPQALKLQQVPGVGPITSLCYLLVVEDPARFATRDVAAWLGLVPRRDQSGARDKQLPISKTGNPYLRKLLVQSAQYLLGPFGPDCDLRRQGLALAERKAGKAGKGAKRKAVVATARKLAGVLHSLWRNQSDYQPLRDEPAEAKETEAQAA